MSGVVVTHAVRLHGDCVWDVGENADGVSSVLAIEETVSLEVKTVDVRLWAQSRQVPRDFVALAHGQARDVPVHEAVDGWRNNTQWG